MNTDVLPRMVLALVGVGLTAYALIKGQQEPWRAKDFIALFVGVILMIVGNCLTIQMIIQR